MYLCIAASTSSILAGLMVELMKSLCRDASLRQRWNIAFIIDAWWKYVLGTLKLKHSIP